MRLGDRPEAGLAPETPASPPAGAVEPSAPRGRRRWWLGGVIALALLAVVGYVAMRVASSGGTDQGRSTPTSTAQVIRTDLTETTSYDGTLGYADTRSVSARSTGTVTWLPAEASAITQGRPLFTINAIPTILFYGTLPMYRTLQSGVSAGTDVLQLERGLKALGHDPDGMSVDSTFDSATVAAIEAWQEALGQTQSGSVTPGQVQFLPGPIRVGSVTATVGDLVQTGGSLYDASGTARIATVALASSDSSVAKVGEKVVVTVPDGTRFAGHVATRTTQAASTSGVGGSGGGSGAVNQQGAGANTTNAKVVVTVAVDDSKAAAQPDQTPVTVAFTSRSSKDVLAVPVTALLALAGGGYALEVVDGDGTTHLTAVTPGLYAVGGTVEVSGEGVSEGTTVVVPAAT